MHRAMRGLMVELLENIAENGLPGEHHFFITFETNYEGVEIAAWLRERYPEDMTIVIQHWFDNLVVSEDSFTITLNFGDQPEPLNIPFDAIKSFVDPSVEFGLRFEGPDDEVEEDEESPMLVVDDEDDDDVSDKEIPRGDADVVSLDSFRK
jgi:hypothetical protein